MQTSRTLAVRQVYCLGPARGASFASDAPDPLGPLLKGARGTPFEGCRSVGAVCNTENACKRDFLGLRPRTRGREPQCVGDELSSSARATRRGVSRKGG